MKTMYVYVWKTMLFPRIFMALLEANTCYHSIYISYCALFYKSWELVGYVITLLLPKNAINLPRIISNHLGVNNDVCDRLLWTRFDLWWHFHYRMKITFFLHGELRSRIVLCRSMFFYWILWMIGLFFWLNYIHLRYTLKVSWYDFLFFRVNYILHNFG